MTAEATAACTLRSPSIAPEASSIRSSSEPGNAAPVPVRPMIASGARIAASFGCGASVGTSCVVYDIGLTPGGRHVPSPGGKIEGGAGLGQYRRITR